MKKLLLFTVLVLAATASAAYSLLLIDNIVHGTLYNFGLQFSSDWANPYWMMMRIAIALMGLAAVFAVVNSVYVYRKYICAKARMMSTRSERKVISSHVQEPEPPSETQRVGGLVKCSHCKRVFSQPLRMLDFHSDRPRIINICPFCNEVIPPILRHEEAERGRKITLRRNRNNQARESRGTLQREEAEETEETVATSA